jgi:hypothetical protein
MRLQVSFGEMNAILSAFLQRDIHVAFYNGDMNVALRFLLNPI